MVFEIERKGHKFEIDVKEEEILVHFDEKVSKSGTKLWVGATLEGGILKFNWGANIKIDGKKVNGLKLTEQEITAIENMKEDEKATEQKIVDEIRNFKITKVQFKFVKAHVEVRCKELEKKFKGHNTSFALNEIEAKLEALDMNKLIEAAEETEGFDWETWYEISTDAEILKEGEEKHEEEVKKFVEQKKLEREEVEAIFEKARKTGEKQLIKQHVVDCDEKGEELGVAIVKEYAMPDGSRKAESNQQY